MKIYSGKKTFGVKLRKVGFFGKIFGLMFRTRETQNLLFEFPTSTKIAIHSYFVFFDFLAIWTNKRGKVIESKIIKPFTLSVKPSRKFEKLIEIPSNEKNKKIIEEILFSHFDF